MGKKLEKKSAALVFRDLSNEILSLRASNDVLNKYRYWHKKVEDSFNEFLVPADLRKKFYDIALDPYDQYFEMSMYTGKSNSFNALSCVLLNIAQSLEVKTAQNNFSNGFAIIERIIQRFHIVRRQLEERHAKRQTLDVQDEYDVQDLFHALLRLYFDDIRTEEWTPKYAGRASRMDFLLPDLNIAIETKMTREGLSEKEVGEQLVIDKEYYRKHANVTHLICFVYDPNGRIKNPRGFEKDLRQERPLRTDVYVRP